MQTGDVDLDFLESVGKKGTNQSKKSYLMVIYQIQMKKSNKTHNSKEPEQCIQYTKYTYTYGSYGIYINKKYIYTYKNISINIYTS